MFDRNASNDLEWLAVRFCVLNIVDERSKSATKSQGTIGRNPLCLTSPGRIKFGQ